MVFTVLLNRKVIVSGVTWAQALALRDHLSRLGNAVAIGCKFS